MWGDDSTDNLSAWGPDTTQDNVYQNMPQVSLHGMDEGLTAKLNLGCIRAAVSEMLQLNDARKPNQAKKKKKWWSKAAVCRRIDRQVALHPPALF
jgi:hypothetical protein